MLEPSPPACLLAASPPSLLFISIFLENVGAICMIFCQLQKKYCQIIYCRKVIMFSFYWEGKKSSVIFIEVSFRRYTFCHTVKWHLTFIWYFNSIWKRPSEVPPNNILTLLLAFRNYWLIIYTMGKLSENNKIWWQTAEWIITRKN